MRFLKGPLPLLPLLVVAVFGCDRQSAAPSHVRGSVPGRIAEAQVLLKVEGMH
jgi:hypothetical protein